MLRKRLFDLLAALAARRPNHVLAAATLLTLACLGLSATLEVKTNFKDTLGPDDPVAQQQAWLEENFPGAFTVMAALEGPNEQDLVEAAHELEAALLDHPEAIRAVYLEQPVDFFAEHGLLYVPPDDLRMAEAAFGRWEPLLAGLRADPSALGAMRLLEGIAAEQSRAGEAAGLVSTRLFGRALPGQGPWDSMGIETAVQVDASPIADRLSERTIDVLKELPLPPPDREVRAQVELANETLDLFADVLEEGERITEDNFAERAERLRELDLERLSDGAQRYRFSPDRQVLLMEIGAVGNINVVEELLPFLEVVRGEVDEVLATRPELRIQLTGFPVMVAEENEALLNNFGLVTALGFVGILAVFVIGFERVGLPALATVPLSMGMIWTFGAQTLVYGDITLFSLAFPVLLLGVGIDFAIHLLSAYAERRSTGVEPEVALRESYDRIGAGLMTGGLTTAAAFLVLMASDFYGLRAMGFTAGMGVLMALFAMVTVLPALVVRFDLRSQRKERLLPDVPFTGLGVVATWVRRHRYWVLAGFLASTIFFAYQGAKVHLDTNYMNILPKSIPSVQAQERILERFGLSNDVTPLLAEDLEHAEQVRLRAEELNTVGSVFSASALIPERQEEKAPLIEALGRRLAALEAPAEAPVHGYDAAEVDQLRRSMARIKGVALEASLLAAVLYEEETQDAIAELRDHLNRIDRRLDPVGAERLRYLDRLLARELARSWEFFEEVTSNTSIRPDELPPAVTDRLRGDDGSWMVLVSANGNVWDDHWRGRFLDELESTGATVAGLVPSTERVMSALVDEIPRMTGLIFALVALLVLIDLRSFRGAVLALVPLVIGIVWTLGVMGVMGMPFNVLSVTAVPMIVGIGIDDGVHLYHRIRHERALGPALQHAGKAVILTSLTTSIGFGSLMLSIHPGFFSLGLVTMIGILSCLVVSLLLLPALVAIFDEETLGDEP